MVEPRHVDAALEAVLKSPANQRQIAEAMKFYEKADVVLDNLSKS